IVSGMVKGQVLDMYQASDTKETLDNINSYKTGALISASLLAGAVVNEMKEEEIKALYEYSILLGKSFQIADDVLDVTSSVEELGKNVGQDAKNNKVTYPSLFGVEGAREILKELESEQIGCLSIFGKRADSLIELTKSLTNRKN
ncbi:MAG: polyprenyl synthetase family protein, partial [Clostridia bacterium]|nr:polyprenyl synthetase family protein [Clostridia bacterium]